jgi:hypothetical protein
MARTLLKSRCAAILALVAATASAELLLYGSFADNIPFGPFATNEEIEVVASLKNLSPDHTITICEGACIGDEFTYSLGAWTSIPNGYSFFHGNGGDTSVGIWKGQIAGPLLPGEEKDFVFGVFVPSSAVVPGWYGVFVNRLQIFAATTDRPMLSQPVFYGNWQVVERASVPESSTLALLSLGLAGLAFSRSKYRLLERQSIYVA